jgi:hypothetical protein
VLCIGLFGTCAGSKWREDHFIPGYDKLGIKWYNPQVDDWNPAMAEEEAEHLAEDAIVLFPVTSESYAFGSLAETGFSMLNAIGLDDRREFVIYIAQTIDEVGPKGEKLNDLHNEDGSENKASQAKASLRTRALVKEHLKKLGTLFRSRTPCGISTHIAKRRKRETRIQRGRGPALSGWKTTFAFGRHCASRCFSDLQHLRRRLGFS